MTICVPNISEAMMMNMLLNVDAPEELDLGLYTNSFASIEASSMGSLTEMGAVGGYAQKAMLTTSWSVAEGDPCQGTYPQETFTFTASAGNVHGYFIQRRTTGDLMWFEKFTDGPYDILNNGDNIKITPVFEIT